MACFIVPAAEAVIVTVAAKVAKSKENAKSEFDGEMCSASTTAVPEGLTVGEPSGRLPFSRKLHWLSNLLWGGSALLAFEHLWHGEITPFFPFLTAASNPADMTAMLHEIGTVGVAMAAIVTLVWCGMLAVSAIAEKKAPKESGLTATEETV